MTLLLETVPGGNSHETLKKKPSMRYTALLFKRLGLVLSGRVLACDTGRPGFHPVPQDLKECT